MVIKVAFNSPLLSPTNFFIYSFEYKGDGEI